MIIWARDAVSADAEHCCSALLPTRVIAGHGTTRAVMVAGVDGAPWIRVSRLCIADLRFAQKRSGNDKKHDDGDARHGLSPCHCSCLPFILAGSLQKRRLRQGHSELPPGQWAVATLCRLGIFPAI